MEAEAEAELEAAAVEESDTESGLATAAAAVVAEADEDGGRSGAESELLSADPARVLLSSSMMASFRSTLKCDILYGSVKVLHKHGYVDIYT